MGQARFHTKLYRYIILQVIGQDEVYTTDGHTHTHTHARTHTTHTFNLEVVEWFRVDASNGPLLVAGEGPIASDYKEPRPPVLDELACQQTAHKQFVMH